MIFASVKGLHLCARQAKQINVQMIDICRRDDDITIPISSTYNFANACVLFIHIDRYKFTADDVGRNTTSKISLSCEYMKFNQNLQLKIS